MCESGKNQNDLHGDFTSLLVRWKVNLAKYMKKNNHLKQSNYIHTQEVNYKKEERARLPATTHNTFTSHACATPSKKDLYYTYLHGI